MKLNPKSFTGKISDSDIRLLRVFCTVTRCGGFAAAESELQLGLPSISRYIKDLEIRLGVRLCRRGRVGFALTEQGRQVYSASLQLIADLERFEADIRSIHSDLVGKLNVGIIDTMITDKKFRMPEVFKNYKKSHPYVEFDIVTKTSNVIEQNVIDGSLDAGIVIGRRHINQLDYKFLYQEEMNLYCSEDHPLFTKNPGSIRLEELSKYDYAAYSFLDGSERTGHAGLLVKTASVDCLETLATLISTGCFLGTLPDHYVQSIWRLKKFKPILPEIFSFATDIELITRRGNASPIVLALMEHLDELADGRTAIKEATAGLLGSVAH